MDLPDPLERFRQPEYTGENRCLPCSVLNVAFAGVVSIALAAVVLYGVGALTAAIAGVGTFALSIGVISLRGYLVPGTPRFTRTYVPDRLLRRLGKEPSRVDDGADVELALKGVGAVRAVEDDRSSSIESDGDGDDQ